PRRSVTELSRSGAYEGAIPMARTSIVFASSLLFASHAALAQEAPAAAPGAAPAAPAPAPTPAPMPAPAPAPVASPAMSAPAEPAAPAKAGGVVSSSFDLKVYGFVEFDAISDSTRSFNDNAGNSNIQYPPKTGSNLAYDNGRFQTSIRNSRFGF